ncbi:MAG: phosphohistidine phosphatase SixA [Anaerolineae bacterium]
MEVYFLRHAHAEDAHDKVPDVQRQLTERGIQHTRRLARCLKELGVAPDRLYTSPLVRANQTADIVSAAIDITVQVRQELAPGFNLAGLQTLIRDLRQDDCLMIVGHEPDFSRVIGDFIGGGRVIMKKGGLARIDVTGFQPLRGELMWLLNPKVISLIG